MKGKIENKFSIVRSESLEQKVYERLKAAIVGNVLKPGDRIIISDVAEQMGVSAMPVRHALKLLEKDRLVETIQHKGAVVSYIAPNDILEIYLHLITRLDWTPAMR